MLIGPNTAPIHLQLRKLATVSLLSEVVLQCELELRDLVTNTIMWYPLSPAYIRPLILDTLSLPEIQTGIVSPS